MRVRPTTGSSLPELLRTLVTAWRSARAGSPVLLDPETSAELRVVLDARKELGRDYDDELVEVFLSRLDAGLRQRIDELWREHERRRRHAAVGQGLVLALLLVAAVPLTAAAGLTAGASGIAVVWVGLILLALVVGLLGRR
ncbi:MAG: hypothetical protein N2Z82_04645 [Thermomicrobium sp.]|nr:hypothetical protein [Thermomicrobium sp.]